MNKSLSLFHPTPLALVGALLAVGFVIADDRVAAQPAEEAAPTAEVMVVVPREIREEVGRTAIGGTVERISITRVVSYADLDLKRNSAVKELDRRINEKATEACKQLDSLYPLLPSDPDCVKNAVDGAAAQKEAAVEAATKAK